MEFRAQYLQAMRQQAPAMFRELSASGELMAFVEQKTKEAHRLYRELLNETEKGPDGKPTLRAQREAQEQVKAMMFEFPSESSLKDYTDQEELNAMLGTRPILPPRL